MQETSFIENEVTFSVFESAFVKFLFAFSVFAIAISVFAIAFSINGVAVSINEASFTVFVSSRDQLYPKNLMTSGGLRLNGVIPPLHPIHAIPSIAP